MASLPRVRPWWLLARPILPCGLVPECSSGALQAGYRSVVLVRVEAEAAVGASAMRLLPCHFRPCGTQQLHRVGGSGFGGVLGILDALAEAFLARLGGMAHVDAVLDAEGVGAELDDQVAHHRAEGFLDGCEGDADDLFGNLLADFFEDPSHGEAGGLGSGEGAEFGESEGEGSGGLGCDHLSCQNGELGDCADLGAFDEEGDAVERRAGQTPALPQVLQMGAVDLAPVGVERFDGQGASRRTHQALDSLVGLVRAAVDVVGELPHGVCHFAVVVLIDIRPRHADDVEDLICPPRQHYAHAKHAPVNQLRWEHAFICVDGSSSCLQDARLISCRPSNGVRQGHPWASDVLTGRLQALRAAAPGPTWRSQGQPRSVPTASRSVHRP